jgi:cytoskeletal protein CcmA (bactofilin family)
MMKVCRWRGWSNGKDSGDRTSDAGWSHAGSGTIRYRNAIVPHIYVDGASEGIAFYKRAFGAVELFRMGRPNGKILHAEISIERNLILSPVVELGRPRALVVGDRMFVFE